MNLGLGKILRKVYGPVTGQCVWRVITRKQLKELYKAPDLLSDIERRKLDWIHLSCLLHDGQIV
jgi:hypothetical protein